MSDDEKDKSQEFGDEMASMEDFDESEINFDDFENTTDEMSPPPLPAARPKSKLPIILGGVLGVFILYKGVMWLFTDKTTDTTVPTIENAEPVPAPQDSNDDMPPIVLEDMPADAPPAPMPTAEPDNDQSDALAFLREARQLSSGGAADNTMPAAAKTTAPVGLSTVEAKSAPQTTAKAPAAPVRIDYERLLEGVQEKLDHQTEETEKRLEAMDRAIYRLTKRMEQVQDGVGQMSNDMGNLSQTLVMLGQEMRKIGQPLDSHMKTEIAKTETFINPDFTVHAIIPGRAWLRDKSGSTITVTEGDVLDQYGKVLVIDAPNGVVITSSGVTLR